MWSLCHLSFQQSPTKGHDHRKPHFQLQSEPMDLPNSPEKCNFGLRCPAVKTEQMHMINARVLDIFVVIFKTKNVPSRWTFVYRWVWSKTGCDPVFHSWPKQMCGDLTSYRRAKGFRCFLAFSCRSSPGKSATLCWSCWTELESLQEREIGFIS